MSIAQQDLDYTTLKWVKDEIRESLEQTRQALEAFVENPNDETQIRFCATYLHQIYGTLQMVEIYGGALLAEEMELLANAISQGKVSRKEDAYDVLMRAILQLPAYLEHLENGQQDMPVILLPLLNDLRTARGEHLLSENAFFSPNLFVNPPEDSIKKNKEPVDIRSYAKKLRPVYQAALVRWYRDIGPQEAISKLSIVVRELLNNSSNENAIRLWWVASGIVEGLLDKGLEPSSSLKQLMGHQIDRQIKRIIDGGEEELEKNPPVELLKNLLYYVATSTSGGARTGQIKSTFNLDQLLPGSVDVNEAFAQLRGSNADLMQSVSAVIKEDLLNVKDQLDLFVRDKDKPVSELAPLSEHLHKVSDTLAMLGLGDLHKIIQDQNRSVNELVQAGTTPSEMSLMEIASALLYVESSLEGVQTAAASRVLDGDKESETLLPPSEQKQLNNLVIEEATKLVLEVKEAFNAYAVDTTQKNAIEVTPGKLDQVRGVLAILGLTRAAKLLHAATDYIRHQLLREDIEPNQRALDLLADVITSIEYFLEAVAEDRGHPENILQVAEASAQELGYTPQAISDMETSQVDIVAPTEVIEVSPKDLETEISEVAEILSTDGLEQAIAEDSPGEQTQPEPAPEPVQAPPVTPPTAATTPATAVELPEDDIDEEILEIFIEEADEVVGTMKENLAAWKQDNNNSEALTVLRRSYHTIKGSGRLAGAKVVGEFAWAIENMLNKIIDGRVEIKPEVFELLLLAESTLEESIKHLKGELDTHPPVQHLVEMADAYAKGEPINISGQQVTELTGEEEPYSIEVEEEETITLESSEPEIMLEDTPAAAEEAQTATTSQEDKLIDIFKKETNTHLSAINNFIIGYSDDNLQTVSEPLMRALHTLHGSANMATVDNVAEVSEHLDRYFSTLYDSKQPVTSDAIDVLTEGATLIRTMMEGIDDDNFVSPNIGELVARINELHDEAKEFEPALDADSLSIVPGTTSHASQDDSITAELIEEQGDGLEESIELVSEEDTNDLVEGFEPIEFESQEDTLPEFDIEEIHASLEEIVPEEEPQEQIAQSPGIQVEEEEVDEELISIFLDEAEEILRNNEALIQGWTSDINDRSIMEELQRGLHTLKGGARMANQLPIANLSHSIESLLEAISNDAAISSQQLPRAVQRCQDWFVLTVEAIRKGQRIEEPVELLNLIQTFVDGLEPVDTEISIPQAIDSAEDENEEIILASDTPSIEEEAETITLESSQDELAEEAEPVEEIELSEITVAPIAESTDEADEDDLLNIFLEEASDIQDQNEQIIQQWIKNNNNLDLTNQLQRSLHTLKGSARMARVTNIADVAHAMESVLERVNDRQLDVVSDLPHLILNAQDWIGNALILATKQAEIPDPSELISSIDDYSMVATEKEEAEVEEIAPEEETIELVSEEPEVEESTVEVPSFEIEEKMETIGATAIDSAAQPAEEADYDEELVEIFLEEAEEIQENVDRILHDWVNDIGNKEMVAEIQRSLHTLKGGARMAGITPIGDLSHAVESLMEAVSEGRLEPTDEYPKTIQTCHDWLHSAITQVKQQQPVSGGDLLIKQLENLLAGKPAMDGLSDSDVKADAAKARKVATPRAKPAKAKPAKKKEQPKAETVEAKQDKPVDTSKLINLPGFSAADDSDATVTPKTEETKQRTAEEQMRVRADLIDNMVNHAGEINIFNSRIGQQLGQWHFNLSELEQTIDRLREQLRNFEMETEAQIMYQHADANTVGSSSSAASFDPLELDRFSYMQQLSRSMVESFDDLISIQRTLEGISGDTDVLLLQQSRINSDLQEELISTRLTPFSSVIARLRRVVRQTCQETDKEADLEVNGAEGEMDRSQLNRIVPALEHILRNAIDHGLETPAARKKAKKPESGKIQINFSREGSEVVLRIIDDGAGINVNAIRKKAIERGLIEKNSQVDDSEVLDFILQSGFSTAEKVTQISGRGVGMDVVNTEIKQLNGSLHIATDKGKGSTFTIRLPLTVLVNQALMVQVDEAIYAISLSNIEHVIRVPNDEINDMLSRSGAEYEYAGNKYQHLNIGYVLHGTAPSKITEKGKQALLLAKSGDHRVALQVDSLIGRQEIVIKSVGPQLSSINSISGATILPDGEVALILDLSTLIRTSHSLLKADDLGKVREVPVAPVVDRLPTVLIVDDSITVRKVTQRLLKRHDYEPMTAKDGMDALTVMLEHIPDIILLDVEMPRMDGYELATAVRSDPRLKHIPIIMITSRTGDKHRDRALSIGVNMYMGKPFQEHELLENIQSLLHDE